MANSKGPSSARNMLFNGRASSLPPKVPFPSIPASYVEFTPASTVDHRITPKLRDGNSHHQRTSSENFLVDEKLSWLDELLDEPEMPLRRGGHRRSSSDSFAYMDIATGGSTGAQSEDDSRYKYMTPMSFGGSKEFDIYKDALDSSSHFDLNPTAKIKNKLGDASSALPYGLPSMIANGFYQKAGSLSSSRDANRSISRLIENQDLAECGYGNPKGSFEENDPSHFKSSETDTKRAKQQYAQRSRVRKLQYIAELERNVQALQVDGSEVSAELEFINQKNLILSMENKALKQRLETLVEEQLIKYMEHDVLEREAGRLRNLYQQQQQQQQQTSSNHRRTRSTDLDQHFASLSLKPKEAGKARNSELSSVHM